MGGTQPTDMITTDTVPAAWRYTLNLSSAATGVHQRPLGGHEFRHAALDAARKAALATPHGIVQVVKDRKIWGHVIARKGGTYTRRAA